MKRFTFLFLSVATVTSLMAQNKIDFAGRSIISATQEAEIASRSAEQFRLVPSAYTVDANQTYDVIITLEDEASIIAGSDIEIISQRDNMAIVRVTAAQMQSLAAMPGVKQVAVGNEVRLMMNHVRETTGINSVQTGADGLGGTKYNGTGVIAGIMDTGLDVNNINFLTSDGELRTKILWKYNSDQTMNSYLTPERIGGFSTDDKSESHGTHVLGIMAGCYSGPAEYAFINSRGSLQTKKQNAANSAMPYYGIATDADLAVACGSFSGSNIDKATANIVDYAKQQGQPCVINLSIGNTYGPHDGTDARSKWLSSLGEDAIICIAAGNEGNMPVSISKTFSNEPLKTFVSNNAKATGIADFWGTDDQVFSVRFIAYNLTTGKEVYSYLIDKNLEGKTTTLTGSYYTATGYVHDPKFDEAFGSMSAIIFSSNIDPNNNRYNVSFTLQLSGSATNIAPAFIVEAKAGQHVDAYANGELYFTSLETEGFTDGSPACSINGMACGENILVVGSYTNLDSWPTLGGMYAYTNNKPVAGAISDFSSYGETFDGRLLPDVCAPGGSVISSYSKYYVEGYCVDNKGVIKPSSITGQYTGAKRNSYWGEMQGTSMACPVVSGIVATWLQADPTLTVNDVKAIIKRTATHDEFTAVEPDRWGAGKINALAGLKDILGLSGISDIAADSAEAIVTSSDNRNFEIFVSGAKKINAQLISLSGLCAAQVVSDGETAALDASSVVPGVYLLKIDSGKTSETKKIVIR